MTVGGETATFLLPELHEPSAIAADSMTKKSLHFLNVHCLSVVLSFASPRRESAKARFYVCPLSRST